jgi:hypothetical protein
MKECPQGGILISRDHMDPVLARSIEHLLTTISVDQVEDTKTDMPEAQASDPR